MTEFQYNMNADMWKTLIDQLKEDGVRICSFPETDQFGKFVDYKYLTVEFNGKFFYMQNADYETGISVTPYRKIDPYHRIQADYPTVVGSYEDLMKFMNNHNVNFHWKKDEVHKQNTHYRLDIIHDGMTNLQYLKNVLAANREKEVLKSLEWIEMIMHTADHYVLRFHSTSPEDWFDYDLCSRKITG